MERRIRHPLCPGVQGGIPAAILTGKAGAGKQDKWEEQEESGSASGSQKKKRKGVQNEAWKEFNDKYTAANEATDEPLFSVMLGKDNYEVYPQEIQIKLRACWEQVQDGNSQNCEYDMTGGWLFNIRLYDEREKREW